MTERLTHAFLRMRVLPPDRQDDVARLLRLVGEEEAAYHLTPAEKASLAASLAESEQGTFASEDEVQAIWARHGL